MGYHFDKSWQVKREGLELLGENSPYETLVDTLRAQNEDGRTEKSAINDT